MNEVVAQIQAAFAAVPYPGDAFVVGSTEGTEPAEAVAPFIGATDWTTLVPEVLDAYADALSFLSDGAFRFFMPAFLVSDLAGALVSADPLFHLTHGFSEGAVSIELQGREFTKKIGRSALLNPRRFGAMTFYDRARSRLSVFAREEADAIVSYLEHKRAADRSLHDIIDAALDSFWRDRATQAPTQARLANHLGEEAEFLRAAAGEEPPSNG